MLQASVVLFPVGEGPLLRILEQKETLSMGTETTRRGLLQAVGTMLVAAQCPRIANGAAPAAGRASAAGVRLQPLPTRAFKTRDPGGERTESWTTWVIVETSTPRELKIQSATTQLLSNGKVVRSTHDEGAGAHVLSIVPPFSPRLPDGRESPTPIVWPLAIRIRNTVAMAAGIDGMRIDLALSEATKVVHAGLSLPVEYYEQKSALIFPFRGKGIVTNAGVTNGGHRNRSGQFALDCVGLDDGYGVYAPGGGRKREDYAGWGRTVAAPAAGTVVRARSDRPDQPDPETSDPKYFAPEYPDGGDPGNHVVIDHGNGEFSMLAHFQAESVVASVGDRVQQGQTLGKLGSSGDTVTPHVHYQLQSGADHAWADGLPCQFSNVENTPLVRGTFFDAGV